MARDVARPVLLSEAKDLPDSNPRRRLDLFAFFALAVHLALALSLRAVAWPEVTTTGYLWSRGLMMYRDIKFPHTPGLMGLLAVGFLLLGPTAFLIRLFSAAPPLAAHFFILRETRDFPAVPRTLASAFFVVSFFVCDGNAVWPTVVMSAMALPLAALLSRRSFAKAGLVIGLAILLKQTGAYLLLLVSLSLVVRKRFRDAWTVLLTGSIPYMATLGAFAVFGSARDMIRWTIEVPFAIRSAISAPPGFVVFWMIGASFGPLGIEAVLERPGEYPLRGRWLLLIATGFALISVPRFDTMQTVAALPCLAVGAARLMRRRPRLLSAATMAFVATFTLVRGMVLVRGADLDGKILFWNEEKSFNLLVEDLRRLPPGTPLYSRLWGNVLPRTKLLPPGRIYVHPWLDYLLPVDRIGERVAEAARTPGTVVVDCWRTGVPGKREGPYVISIVPRQ